MKLKPTSLQARKASLRSEELTIHAGFTLLEMAVVLAIIMILSLVIFSTTLRQLDRVAAEKELANLSSYAEALQKSIQRNGAIPAATTGAAVIAAELGANPAAVATNDRRRARLLLVDPALRIGPGGGGLPYTQGVNGSTNLPASPRLILVSCLSPSPLPAALTGGTYTIADFTNLWNWAAADQTLPAGTLWTGWRGTGLDLQVQRLNLAPLFVRLVLMNYPATTNLGRYNLGTTISSVPNTTGVNAYFIKNTLIGLLNGNGRSDAQLLVRDSNFYYADGVWRAYPEVAAPTQVGMGAIMEQMMTQFRGSPRNSNADHGATPNSAADAIEAFMQAYVLWADGEFQNATLKAAAYDANEDMKHALKDLSKDFKAGECY